MGVFNSSYIEAMCVKWLGLIKVFLIFNVEWCIKIDLEHSHGYSNNTFDKAITPEISPEKKFHLETMYMAGERKQELYSKAAAKKMGGNVSRGIRHSTRFSDNLGPNLKVNDRSIAL